MLSACSITEIWIHMVFFVLFCMWKMAKFPFNGSISTVVARNFCGNEMQNIIAFTWCVVVCSRVRVWGEKMWVKQTVKNCRLSNWLNGFIDSTAETNWRWLLANGNWNRSLSAFFCNNYVCLHMRYLALWDQKKIEWNIRKIYSLFLSHKRNFKYIRSNCFSNFDVFLSFGCQ